MTVSRTPAPPLSEAEARIAARFEAAEYPGEVAAIRAALDGKGADHQHAWSDWYRVIFYRDSLGRLLSRVGIGRLGGASQPATDIGWTRACIVCNTEEQW